MRNVNNDFPGKREPYGQDSDENKRAKSDDKGGLFSNIAKRIWVNQESSELQADEWDGFKMSSDEIEAQQAELERFEQNNNKKSSELQADELEGLRLSPEEIEAQQKAMNEFLNQNNKSNKDDVFFESNFESDALTEAQLAALLNDGQNGSVHDVVSKSRNDMRIDSNAKLSPEERQGKLQKLYTTKARDGWPILYSKLAEIENLDGIENAGNSCTIASLLFNMFAVTTFFDEFFLVGPDKESKNTIKIREKLIKITNLLRSVRPIVKKRDLIELRCLVMYGQDLQELYSPLKKTMKFNDFFNNLCDGFSTMQSDEFLNPLFNSLGIDLENNNEFVNYSITDISGAERQDELIAIENIMKAENFKIIESVNNRVLFINAPKQQSRTFIAGYGKVEGFENSKTCDITPNLKLKVNGQNYKLQSIVANENAFHTFSYVIKEKEVGYFNGGGGGNDGTKVGESVVKSKRGLYELLENPKGFEHASRAEKTDFSKLIRDSAFYIYIRDNS